jgi:mannose-6-phosphate isomerase-like protein (cupin superfamily)
VYGLARNPSAGEGVQPVAADLLEPDTLLNMYQSTQIIDPMQRAKGLSGEYENVVLSEFNDHVVRMSRMEKAYFWHFHPNSDEMFLGVEGVLVLELETQRIELGPGQMFNVARGVRHRTLPAGSYSVNLTFERLDMETVSVDADLSLPI